MIYCNLKGALGNMMFQVAAVTAIAKKNNTTASFPNLDRHLRFLNVDKVHLPSLSHAEEYRFLFSDLTTESPRATLPLIKFPFHFEMKDVPKECWVDGFFQSEKYFVENRDFILKMFSPTKEINNFLNNYSAILCKRTVSLHVRRGDYLKFSHIHPVLPMSYYQKALETIPPFDKCLVFSDDIAWCKKNFLGEKFVFIDDKDYYELFLMSRCDHHIVANSSFSWWGAWLNKNPNKVVIANKTLVTEAAEIDIKDRNPEDWVIL